MSRLLMHIFFFLIFLISTNSSQFSVCDESDDDLRRSGRFLKRTLSCLNDEAKSGHPAHCVIGKRRKIYGFAQCRGDLNERNCSTCIRHAGLKAKIECGGKTKARVYGDECVVFYQNSPFSSDVLGNPVREAECGKEEAIVDPATFSKSLGNLSEEAAGMEGRGFAVGNYGGISAIAQCWSVVGEGCGDCLRKARDVLAAGNCLARSEGEAVLEGCFIGYRRFPVDSKVQIFSSPPPSKLQSQSPSPRRHSSSALLFFFGGVVLLVILLVLLFVFWKCIKPARLKMMLAPSKDIQAPDLFSGNLRTISYFNYRTLRKATRNFDPSNQLGRGGFGPVYKGKLDDGRMIAVKKLAVEKSQQGESEFLAEVRVITSIQHKNLVRLIGCCSDGSERLLVYEYMKNRSLDVIIYGKSDRFLNWKTRFQIILGIARGLQYLHEDSHLRIVHRDIKASNILLDEKFQPKIGDFGLARFFPEDQAYLSTAFAGTLGYTAPEYAIRGELTEKADIYSFGVLVLEIVGCRKNTDLTLPSKMQYLPEYTWKLYEKSRVVDLVDPKLRADGFVEKDVLQAIHVALLCIQSYPNLRPPMSEIVAMLTCKVENIGTPMKPAFLDRRRRTKMDQSWENVSEILFSPFPIDSPSFPFPDKSSSS